MKHVQINKFHKDNSTDFVVYLGNGTCHKFKQERQAKRFLSVTNNFLTKKLYELRTLYTQIEAHYNRNWGYFLHDKKSMTSKKSMDDMFCKEQIRFMQDQFDLIIERCDYTNGNYFAFQKTTLIISIAKSVILKLDNLNKSKSNAADRFEYDAIFERLNYLEKDVNSYAQNDTHLLFKMPLHLNDQQEYVPTLNILSA